MRSRGETLAEYFQERTHLVALEPLRRSPFLRDGVVAGAVTQRETNLYSAGFRV